MYDLIIKRQAQKKLKTLPPGARAKIVGQIKILGIDPEDLRLDVKKMQGGTGYRLRIGQWRVLFERDDEIKIISIEKVGARGGVYK